MEGRDFLVYVYLTSCDFLCMFMSIYKRVFICMYEFVYVNCVRRKLIVGECM